MNAQLSIIDMALHADRVVQAVMMLLMVMSLFCWTIILEKLFSLRRARRAVRQLARLSQAPSPLSERAATAALILQSTIDSGLRESRDRAGNETRADFRERIERSMRESLGRQLAAPGRGTAFLATVGSSAPFIGLFGTVWGIMNSFMGIASAGDTSLAIVAPGIAEALFATAIGLVTAIPAVVAFNKISSSHRAIIREGLLAISQIGNRLTAGQLACEDIGGRHES